MFNKQKFIIFVAFKKNLSYKAMKQYVSKERERLEQELLFYLRKSRFFRCRFTYKEDLDKIISDIVEELKKRCIITTHILKWETANSLQKRYDNTRKI